MKKLIGPFGRLDTENTENTENTEDEVHLSAIDIVKKRMNSYNSDSLKL